MKTRRHTNKPVMRAATRFKPWDYGFMLDLESKCLIEMAKYFETSDIAEGNPRRARECRLMAKLMAIANDEDTRYYESPEHKVVPSGYGLTYRLEFKGEGKMKKHVNINNAYRFIQQYKDSPLFRSVLRQQKAWYLYNRMRQQYLRDCWD